MLTDQDRNTKMQCSLSITPGKKRNPAWVYLSCQGFHNSSIEFTSVHFACYFTEHICNIHELNFCCQHVSVIGYLSFLECSLSTYHTYNVASYGMANCIAAPMHHLSLNYKETPFIFNRTHFQYYTCYLVVIQEGCN